MSKNAKKYALLIGSSTYTDGRIPKLLAPKQDIELLGATLEDQSIGGFQVTYRFDIDIGDAQRHVMSLFKGRSEDDLLLLYYAGHGFRDDEGGLHLALRHTDLDYLEANSLDTHFILKQVNASKSKRKVLILDCCHSGAILPGGVLPRSFPVDKALIRSKFLPEGYGTHILAASQSDQSAFEKMDKATGRSYSIYTSLLIEGIREGKAAPHKENITVSDVHNYIRNNRGKEGVKTDPVRAVFDARDELAICRNPLFVPAGSNESIGVTAAVTSDVNEYSNPDPTLIVSRPIIGDTLTVWPAALISLAACLVFSSNFIMGLWVTSLRESDPATRLIQGGMTSLSLCVLSLFLYLATRHFLGDVLHSTENTTRLRSFLSITLPLFISIAPPMYFFANAASSSEESRAVQTDMVSEIERRIVGMPHGITEFVSEIPIHGLNIVPDLAAMVLIILILQVMLQRFSVERFLDRRGVSIWTSVFFLLAFSTVALAQIFPLTFPRFLGPVPLICIFWCMIISLAISLNYLSKRYGVPYLVLTPLVVFIFGYLNLNNNASLDVSAESEVSERNGGLPFESAFRQWLASRPDRKRFAEKGRPYPIYIVAAPAGGISSANHAASFLASVQEQVPDFRHHLFAISGVSGGSIGASLFAAALKDIPQQILTTNPSLLSNAMHQFFQRDFSSPLIASALFPEFVQLFLPFPIRQFDKARRFESSLEAAWDDVAIKYLPPDMNHRGLRHKFGDMWDPRMSVPALFLNAADASSGRRVIFSAFEYKGVNALAVSNSVSSNINISTAAVGSSRSPLLFDPGYYWEPEPNRELIRVVDGAYIDPTGIATAAELFDNINAYSKAVGEAVDVKILSLVQDRPWKESETGRRSPSLFDNVFFTPLIALLNVRSVQNYTSAREVESRLNLGPKRSFIKIPLLQIFGAGGIGWAQSTVSQGAIEAQRGDAGKCIDTGETRHSLEVDCIIRSLQKEVAAED